MLLLGSKTFTIDGVTVFSDHADPNQFWYLPAPVKLEKRENHEPAFTLIKYRPAQVEAGVKGGGYLMFTAAVPLDRSKETELAAKIASVFPDATDPRLAVVPFDEGTVQCVALNLQGPGGTAAPTAVPGAFDAVEKILGATTPSLMGNNDAVFSLTLSQEGANILEDAFDHELEPVGVIYQLKYTGVRPALDVKVTADLKRAYQAFSVGLSAQAYYVTVGIDATWEKLVQDRAITVQVTNLAPNDAENREKEEWALKLFKDQLLTDWFTPSLSPATAQAEDVGVPALPPPKPDKPAADKPAVDEPAVDEPAADEPAADAKAAAGKAGGKATVDKIASGAKTVVDGAKAVADKLAPQGSNPANAAAGAAPFGAALRLRYVNQDEQKTVTVEYHRQDAVQRIYAPQGYFGAFLKSVDRSKHVLDVDLDNPFFRQLDVVGTPPKDFAAIGLRSVHVGIDYGDPGDPDQHKHGEMMFDDKTPAPQTWRVYKNLGDSREYAYTVDYHFDSQSGWDAEKATYSFPATKTENSDLTLNPFEFLSFAEVRVAPGRINWDLVDYIEVDLDYTSPTGWSATKHSEFRLDTKPMSWKLRLEGRAALALGHRFTHHLKDGTTISGDRIAAAAPAVIVEDPFFYFNVQVEPLLDATQTKQAFLDIKYDDEAASYSFETSFTFTAATSGTPQRIRFPILDVKKRTWQYQVTIVGTGNRIVRGPWTQTDQNEIFVTDSGGQ